MLNFEVLLKITRFLRNVMIIYKVLLYGNLKSLIC